VERATLSFVDASPNTAVNFLGIHVLSSYTITLSGEPGDTADIWYDSSHAGSVTFDGDGSASITVGGSLIDLGLSDPLVRAAYADGSGEIQSHLKSI